MRWSLWEYEGAYTRFYAGCDKLAQASIDSRLEVLLELGNMAREPYSKPVRDGIFELRSQRGARVLYFFQPDHKIVVVLGVIKNQRKLDKDDIRNAIKLKQLAEACEELKHVNTTH
jgi:putative component of toxin-antitoxin plasmid stabilization module